ncbi:MAG: arsenate reductase family protein [Ruminococcus sp.]|nr:arsenate reductase family protein [Ruminococcus sp.]
MEFVCYPKCTTCQKAQKWLDQKKAEYTVRDIKIQNPTYEELKKWHKASGLPLKRFFNTSGQLYRSMELKDKLADMTEEEQLRLLATDGMLVKRPILISGDKVFPGFKETEWEKLL